EAHNINLVTPTPHVKAIIEAVSIARSGGLYIPVVYNTNAYETEETIESLRGTVDIYLPDYKYSSAKWASELSSAPDYPEVALTAIKAMYEQVGGLVTENGIAVKGLLVRHLVLPNLLSNTRGVLDALAQVLPMDTHISLMCQYTPVYGAVEIP